MEAAAFSLMLSVLVWGVVHVSPLKGKQPGVLIDYHSQIPTALK